MTARHTLVQITDLHLVSEGRLLYERIDTFDVLSRTLAAVELARVSPAALVFTGDLADSGEPGAYQLFVSWSGRSRPGRAPPALYVMGNPTTARPGLVVDDHHHHRIASIGGRIARPRPGAAAS